MTTLTYSHDYADVVLLDVSNEHVRKAIETPNARLYFKGDEDAVLCTKDMTFALYSRETSNELLLVSGDQVKGCGAHRVIEPCKVQPRLNQLKRILMEHELPLEGDEPEEFGDNNEEEQEEWAKRARKAEPPKFDDLLRSVQASELELKAGLLALGAFQLNGEDDGWRVLSRSFEERVIEQFILAVRAESINCDEDALEEAQVVEWLSEFPAPIVRSVYSRFVTADGKFNVPALARFLAEELLIKSLRKEMPADALWLKIKERLPSFKVYPDLADVLKRIALWSEDKATVSYFPADSLSRDPRKRCEDLFIARTFWVPTDFEAYLEDVDGGAADALAKYARPSSNDKGERGYIKR